MTRGRLSRRPATWAIRGLLPGSRLTDAGFGRKTFHDLWFEDEAKLKLKLRTDEIRLGVAYKFCSALRSDFLPRRKLGPFIT